MLLPHLVAQLLGLFDELGIAYLVGGSFASSAWGKPRQTHDLDLSVYLYTEQVAPLVARLSGDFMISQQEIEDALATTEDYRGFQLIHFEEVFKIDCFLRTLNVPYEKICLERGRSVQIRPDYSAKFMSPEDTVLTKLRWYELGNRVSDRQWNDIVQVLEVQHGQLDLDYLREWALFFNVSDLFESALMQGES